MNNRNNILDISKAIAMIFIVIGHVVQRSISGYTSNWISSFFLVAGIPIYFLISGIAINYRKVLTPLGFLYDVVKRALMYMLPVVLFLLLRVTFYKQWEDFPTAFSGFIDYPGWGLWALWLIVWYNALVDIALLVSYFLPKWRKLIISITFVIAFIIFIVLRNQNVIETYHFIGYDYFVIYTPIFFIGYLLGDKIFTYINKWVSIIVSVLALAGIIVITRLSTPFYSNGYHVEEHLYIFYLASLCAFGFYYGISTLLDKVKFGKYVGFCGRFTLECYFLHLVLIKNWGNIRQENPWLTTLFAIGLTLLCLVNTAAVVAILYFIPFGHFLMFGRHYSFYKFENRIFDKLKEICTKDYFKKNNDNINNITQ